MPHLRREMRCHLLIVLQRLLLGNAIEGRTLLVAVGKVLQLLPLLPTT